MLADIGGEAALAGALVPIACVGETLPERERGEATAVVSRQLEALLAVLLPPERWVIAYEPVWAIGTGRNATPEQAQEMHAHVRARIRERFGAAAASVRVLYGGSVTPENAASLLAMPDVDGALVGGASLSAHTFVPIVRAGAGAAH